MTMGTDNEIERILAMSDEECLAVGIAQYGNEEAWRAAMADLRRRMLSAAMRKASPTDGASPDPDKGQAPQTRIP